jgi:hypothetical protein
MPANLIDLTRQEKAAVAQQVHDLLAGRLQAKGPEAALDAYIAPLSRVAGALQTHVAGKATASSAHTRHVAALVSADVEVDTWYRHAEAYVSIEAHRREGPNVGAALALHRTTWPEGLAHIDDPPADENPIVRAALQVLQGPAFAATVAAIGLPTSWLTALASGLAASDAAVAALAADALDTTVHVAEGRDAEAEFVSLMVRLRKYVGQRADPSDVATTREGEALLRPLLDALKQKRAAAKARATRAARKNPEPAPTPTK